MQKPNIIHIICHDLGRCLNIYGRTPIETPNIDRLASEGMLFSNHFCTAPFCSPSRGAITTGRYPHTNGLAGLVNLGWELPDSEITTQEHLKRASYTTYLFGGQHERSDPNDLKYDYVDVSASRKEYSGRIAEFLKESQSEPFYLNYFIYEPHRPFLKLGPVASGELYGRPDYDNYDDPGDKVWIPPYMPNNEFVRKEMAGFQRLVKTMDSYVGQVLDGLQKSGKADNTLVIFTTDHGIDMPRAKGTLYDPGIEATMIMRWPDYIAPGTVSDELLSHVDLLPTLLDIAGLKIPANIQGRSYLSLLNNSEYFPREEIFAELGARDPMRCIRTRTHKLIFNVISHRRQGIPSLGQMNIIDTVPEQLIRSRPLVEVYNLIEDPLEKNNLWNHPEYKDIQDDLKTRLQQWMMETDDSILQGILPIPNLTDKI